jgi:hypothetical protein
MVGLIWKGLKNMKNHKFMTEYEKRLATRIKVEISGDIDQYARSFLAIYNNVKNHPELFDMYNDYSNGVFVTCEQVAKDDAVEFLSQFGEIVKVDTVEAIFPLFNDYEYRDDIDTEFINFKE